MILTDPNLPDNPVVFANCPFQDLTGYQGDEVLGRNCSFLQGAHTDRESVDELRQAVNEPLRRLEPRSTRSQRGYFLTSDGAAFILFDGLRR